jgi:ParB family chromosome partitioning protein
MTLLDLDSTPPKQKSNEWYTPARYVDAAREVMGGIDLDPASCVMANQVVKAKRYYTKEDNGLEQEWYGRMWLNPPYGHTQGGIAMSHQKAFAHKLLREYQSGNVEQAVLLSLGNPNSVWFQPFFDFILCFYCGHIDFYRPDGSTSSFGFPLAFVYLGPNETKFIDIFSQFGRIAKAIDTPKQAVKSPALWEVKSE